MKTSAIRRGLLLMLACTVVFGLGACTSSYKQRETGGLDASSVRLDASKNVFVSVPPDGQYGSGVSRDRPDRGTKDRRCILAICAARRGRRRARFGPTSFWQPRAMPALAIL